MRRTIAVFLSAVVILAAEFFTNGQQAFAGKCEKYEYRAPVGVSLLTEKQVLARVADHTVDTPNWKIYFGRDGTLVYYTNFETFPGDWYSCGAVVVFDWFNDDHDTERLFAMPREGILVFYDLTGEYIRTYALREGRTF